MPSQPRIAGSFSSPRPAIVFAVTAPQWECPHTTISGTCRPSTAYSIVAISLDAESGRYSGTTLPAVRNSNSCPGSAPVIFAGITRESEQVMNR